MMSLSSKTHHSFEVDKVDDFKWPAAQQMQDADSSSNCDASTEVDAAEGTHSLPCYGHIIGSSDGEESMDEADDVRVQKKQLRKSSSRQTSRKGAAVKETAMDDSSLSTSEVARMVSQNARLTLENQRLREQCEKAAAAAQAAAAAAASAAAGVAACSSAPSSSSSSDSDAVAEEAAAVPSSQQSCVFVDSSGMAMAAPMVAQPYNMMAQWWSPVPFPYMAPAGPMPMQACYVMPAPMSADFAAQDCFPQPQQQQRSKAGRRGGAAQEPGATVAAAACKQPEVECPVEERTTVMLRNMPNNYNRKMLLQMMDREGFAGQYNFVYMPIDFKSRASLGYAFINLTSPEMARKFWAVFEGYSKWMLPSRKVSKVSWSSPHQGLQAHVDRYRNSPLMHPDVPDDYRPIMLEDGVRAPFPEPTKRLRAPRVRHSPAERLNNDGSMMYGEPQNCRSIACDEAAAAPVEACGTLVEDLAATMTDEEDFWY
mmetsp:Transcript_53900/g.128370  ORF Transcript_53900/g.128370 Transcript_53900/m.128370 type:complete len:483 (+) Transcript_53900:156-1604(+)|eukprot:CAMPEP_0178441050 /NCGR_PEP_ID=MMETSP0689_2-20121128/37242_1 /TAXON_ID=160604 /ORGANISM="Amphidinium massartii, Strain CS-259" /LENGTH=482 /DNA_ID=CAMNT_0020064139 /DNA_START=61 /DNA_END=1509 /DNA_ORIENTATION=-